MGLVMKLRRRRDSLSTRAQVNWRPFATTRQTESFGQAHATVAFADKKSSYASGPILPADPYGL